MNTRQLPAESTHPHSKALLPLDNREDGGKGVANQKCRPSFGYQFAALLGRNVKILTRYIVCVCGGGGGGGGMQIMLLFLL